MNRITCLSFCEKINKASNMIECIDILNKLIKSRQCKGYFKRYAKKLFQALCNGKPFFQVIKKDGNSKLPFYAFSSLPLYSCPGAGECKKWCYSLKAWRYPAAFFRQVQNFIFMNHDKNHIVNSFNDIKPNSKLRLYVDGDFSSREDVIFWFNLLKNRPDVKTYGYSKSWDIIYSCKEYYPNNYYLNLSSGGIAQNVSKADMLSLSITRGEFIAVKTSKLTPEKHKIRFSLPEYHNEVRQNGMELTGKKGFSCPGKCGDCSTGSHACGSEKFKGIPIFIGVH